MPAFGPTLQAFAVDQSIHLGGPRAPAFATRFTPMFGEIFCILPPTFETGPVPGGERGRLVEKKQLGIEPPSYVALTSFKCQHATDPLP